MPKNRWKSRFQIEDIGIIFQRFPSQTQKTTEIPFSNRRYWHYFPEGPITSPKKRRKSRFQIEDIGSIFSQGSHHNPKNDGNPVFKKKILVLFSRGSHHKPEKKEIPFSNRRYWHCFPEVPITHKPQKNTEIPFSNGRYWHYFPKVPITSPKNHGNPVFK